jgi:hypothetical protein
MHNLIHAGEKRKGFSQTARRARRFARGFTVCYVFVGRNDRPAFRVIGNLGYYRRHTPTPGNGAQELPSGGASRAMPRAGR